MTRCMNTFSILSSIVIALTALFATAGTSIAQSDWVFALQLSTQAFSTMMCKKIRPDQHIRIRIANHRDLLLKKVPNQFIPQQFEEARKKTYVHYLTLEDLTNERIEQGAIAFNTKHAVIFSKRHPQGISRKDFVAQLPAAKTSVANHAFNTFLRLHPILNAAIDGCRPYPSQVTYGTHDEIDKIEAGRLKYRDLAKHYNTHPTPQKEIIRHEGGTSGGFYDPRTQSKRVSYQAANPLNFYRP